MDELVQWLTAQLAEDERLALKSVEQAIVNLNGADAASVANWHVVERPATGTFVATRDQWNRVAEIVPTYGGAHSEHIAEHDPARVLREIDAKRQIVARYEELCAASKEQGLIGDVTEEYQDFLLRLLALPYTDRPGYQEGWTP